VSAQAKNTSILKGLRDRGNLTGVMPIITLAILVLIMTIGTRRFFTLSNITGMVEQGSTLLVMGLGETFVILLGSIDLSIAAVAALVTIITAMLIPSVGYAAFPIAFLCGAGTGLLTGLVHTRARIPSFVASLGAMGLWTGVAFTISKATPITVAQANNHYLSWVTGTTWGIPNVILVAMCALVICWILAEYTPFGRYVKVIGAGERAATVSGVAINKYKTLAFVLCGALAGLSGVLLSARMAGGSARMADGFQMRAIAVVILGGTSISGGVGGPLRTFIGVLIVMVLDTGMNMVGVNAWFQQAIYGAILILAVALTIDRNRMSIIK
jgi:ribose transport system permease protein